MSKKSIRQSKKLITKIWSYYANRLFIRIAGAKPKPKNDWFVLRKSDGDKGEFDLRASLLMMAAANRHPIDIVTGHFKEKETATISNFTVHYD